MNEGEYKQNQLLIMLFILGISYIIFSIILEFLFSISLGYGICLINLVGYVIIILSAYFVYKDAQQINASREYPGQKLFAPMTWTPFSWGMLVLFFPILLFLLYLIKRQDIYWKNQPVQRYSMDRKRYMTRVEIQNKEPPPQPKYGEKVRLCPNCDTPYSIRMLERSNECKVCGEPLK